MIRSLTLLVCLGSVQIGLGSVLTGNTKTINNNGDGSLELLILHNNDMHARFEQTSKYQGAECKEKEKAAGKCYGGFARVSTVVKKARSSAASGSAPHVLYLNAGDTYTGNVWFTVYKWQIAAACLNALKPDAVSLGNHEFDNGISGLTPFIENLSSPVLSANIDLSLEPALAAESNLKNSTIFTIDGVKVGVIGYLTPDTKFLSARNNVKYIEEVAAVREEAKKLKAQGVNILIALGHSGYKKDLEIAKEVEDIDLVIGGHTNTFLWNGTSPDAEKIQGPYPTMVKQASGRMVPVVQAYAYTKYLGSLRLKFNSEGEIESYSGQPILLDSSIEEDPALLELLDQFRPLVKETQEEVIGRTRVTLDGECRLSECNMGNLIADAMVYKRAIEFQGTTWTDAAIAVIQGGGVRSSIIPADSIGNITRGEILGVLPFEANMRMITVNGSTLVKIIEHSVEWYDSVAANGAFLQFSGVRVTYDLSRPAGSRIEQVVVRCWSCVIPQYYDIDSWRDYKLLVPEFLAQGGDGFTMMNTESLESEELPYNEMDCLIEYLQRRSPVYPEVAERVILLNVPVTETEAVGSSAVTSSLAIATAVIACLLAQL